MALASGAFAQTEAAMPTESTVVAASETEELKKLTGQTVTVEGTVTRVGSTESGGITFLNMGPAPGGFVAVAFQSVYKLFPDGFEKFANKKVRVTGVIQLYKDVTPQIVIESAAQIKVVEAGAAPMP